MVTEKAIPIVDKTYGDEEARAKLRERCKDSDRFAHEVTPEVVLRLLDVYEADLADIGFIIDQVAEVYGHISGGMLSKPNYHAHAVIAVADDVTTKLVDEAVAEALAPFREIADDPELDPDVRAALQEALRDGEPAIQILEQTDVTVEDMGSIGDEPKETHGTLWFAAKKWCSEHGAELVSVGRGHVMTKCVWKAEVRFESGRTFTVHGRDQATVIRQLNYLATKLKAAT